MAAEDKKISELNEVTVDIDSLSNSIYIPIVYQGMTQKVDLRKIIDSIKSKIASITPYEQDQSGEQIDSNTIQTLANSIATLRNEIIELQNEDNWPKHTITLAAQDMQMQYVLKTCPRPNGQNVDFTINTSQVQIPNFYATLNVSRPTISGTTVYVDATFSISNNYSNLQLTGGVIGELAATGSVMVATQGGTGLISLSGSTSSDIELSNNSPGMQSFTIRLVGDSDMPQDGEIQSVELYGTVQGVSIPGKATYSMSNNASFGANGYIMLSNNGS